MIASGSQCLPALAARKILRGMAAFSRADRRHKRRVENIVVTGAQNTLAQVIVRHLQQKGFEVNAFERGDDPAAAVAIADAVVVLDAASSGVVTDYRDALEAVAQALPYGSTTCLVTVTLVPVRAEARESARSRWETVEADLAQAGYMVSAIRVGLVVGSPDAAGPLDEAIFATGGDVIYPGKGDQRVRPLLVGDLAKVVVACVHNPSRPQTVDLEGPDEFAIRDFLGRLNPDKRTRGEHTTTLAKVLSALAVIITAVGVAAPGIPTGVRSLVFLGGFVAFMGGIAVFAFRRGARSLPDTDMLLCHTPRSAVLGVELRRITEVWTEQALKKRASFGSRKKVAYADLRWSGAIGPAFIAYGLLLVVVGVHDVALSLVSLGTRVAGLGLSMFGLLILSGGIAMLTRWPGRYVLGFLSSAGVVATIGGVTLVALLVNGDEPAWSALVALYATIVGVGLCGYLWKRGGLVVKNVLSTRGQRVVGSVILGGALVTATQTIYTAVSASTGSTPLMTASATVGHPFPVTVTPSSVLGSRIGVPVTMNVKNPTDSPLRVIGAYYEFRIFKVRPSPRGPKRKLLARAINFRRREHFFSDVGPPTIVESGAPFPVGAIVDPGGELSRRVVVIAPTGYPLADLRLGVAFARVRYARQHYVKTMRTTRQVSVSTWRIDDPSWLHLWTRSPRYVHVVYSPTSHLECRQGHSIDAYVDNYRDPVYPYDCRTANHLTDYYGIGVESVGVQAWLGDPAR